MATSKIEKTNPRLRFNLFKKAEDELTAQLLDHEKEIKRLIAELGTVRNLLDEASSDIEQKQAEELEDEREKLEQQREALEEMVSTSQQKRQEPQEEEEINFMDNYTPVTTERLTMAASYSTRQELYSLQQKEEWTPDDAYKFFEISQAVQTTREYSFSTPIQENITQTYDLIKNVAQSRQQDITANYDATKVEEFKPYQSTTTQQVFNPQTSTADDIKQYDNLESTLTSNKPVFNEQQSQNKGLLKTENIKEKYKLDK